RRPDQLRPDVGRHGGHRPDRPFRPWAEPDRRGRRSALMSFLVLKGVQKQFPGAPRAAVEDFNLAAEKGEFVSFLGPSGCGKTTTLRMVAGFETPTSGEIIINGVEVSTLPANKRQIGMVFQSYALFPNMSVRDNIGFGLKIA